MSTSIDSERSDLDQLRTHIDGLLLKGLECRHFEFAVSVKPKGPSKTSVTVKAGASKQFVIRDEQLRPPVK